MRPNLSTFSALACGAVLLTAASSTAGLWKGSVAETGTMANPRAAHTATLLGDGRVLVAGGCTEQGCEVGEGSATAELYDPASRRFRPAGRMATARAGHTATPLPDGRVLLAGGWSGARQLSTAEVYDPATRRFTAAGSMLRERSGHTATRLRDGRVLLAGGDGGVRQAEVYDARTGRFTAAGEMAEPRQAPTATLLADGRVLVAGGSAGRDGVRASAEIYDPRTGQWSATGAMRTARHKHGAVALRDGRVLVVGGSDARDWRGRHAGAEIYDPRTGRFAATARMGEPRFKLPGAVVLLGNGFPLIAGGGERVEWYDPAEEGFRPTLGTLESAWMFSTATSLADGSVLILGGYDDRLRVTPRAWLFRG